VTSLRTASALLSAALLALLAPQAHSDPGLGAPKTFCENDDDKLHHGYLAATTHQGGPASPEVVQGHTDGSALAQDRQHNYWCQWTDTGFDDHEEFALGGAVLAGGISGRSENCLGVAGHHFFLWWPTIHVHDAVLGEGVEFWVLADWAPEGADVAFPCGDGIVEPCTGEPGEVCNPRDDAVNAIGSAVPLFNAGADGSYVVLVEGTSGHVWTTF
jgi:hypothetical protein